MPVHDWARVEAGIFHAMHVSWIPEINRALNAGLLPDGYYALPEQHAASKVADVLTLHASPVDPPEPRPWPPASGGTALADAPPRTRRRQSIEPLGIARRRSIAIRHVSQHRLVALIEIVSPANKDRARTVADFANKAAEALESGVHLLVVDLFRPGRHDPYGIDGAIRQRLALADEPVGTPDDVPPADEPFALAAYAAGPRVEAFVEHVGVGGRLPDMPLFIRPDRYVNVPLEDTYNAAYGGGMPRFWKDVLEGRGPAAAD